MPVGFDYVPSTAAASAVYVEQKPESRSKAALLLPQRITFPAQYNTGKSPVNNVPVQILSLGDIQTRAGRGSMAALMYDAIRRTSGGVDIWWIPVADNAGGAIATKTITIVGVAGSAGIKSFLIGGRKVSFSIANADAIATQATNLSAAINADLDNPFTASPAAGVVTLTARNKGIAGNLNAIIADPDLGDASAVPATTTYTIATGVSGTLDPVLDTALGNLGPDFHTVLVNPYDASDTVALASFETAFTARLDPSVKRPFAMIMGYNDTIANFTTALGSRNSPGTTMVPVEGSPNPPWEIACVAAGILARSADAAPGKPVRGLILTGIRGNASYPIWSGAQRDTIVRAGGSWTRLLADGTVQIGDLVTTYKTNALLVNDSATSWRFTETISNVQAKIYSIDALLGSDPYIRAVVVDDTSVSSASFVVRPKTLKSDLIGLVDQLWIPNGWSKNRAAIVAGITVEINGGNPTRLDCYIPDVLAGGLRIIAAKYGWAFSPAA